MMSESTTITIRVDQSIKDRLDAIATISRRSRSFLAAEAIEEYLSVQEWQINGIRKAMASADRGDVVPHEEVIAWAKSLASARPLAKPRPRRR
ncbi:MAG: CopG family ribbon-helix-helix protein [Verrucomicrobiales bacterium]